MAASKTLTRPSTHLQRRGFLQLGAAAAVSFLTRRATHLTSNFANQLGRVAASQVDSFAGATLESRKVRTHYQDAVFPLWEATIGEAADRLQQTWYRLGEHEYVPAAHIQPVKIIKNQPPAEIPKNGLLGEISVPFTDAFWGPGSNNEFAYRFYYASTHWVTGLANDPKGEPWLQVWDDKWDFSYYAPAAHVRLLPPEALAPLSPHIPEDEKRIEVHLAAQAMVAYEAGHPVFSARISSGAKFSNGNFETPTGDFRILRKQPSRHMAAGDIASNGYDLPGVPWISYITPQGIAFHGSYWHNDFGRARSHGCINLTPQAAHWIYRWTTPVVAPQARHMHRSNGTRVKVIV